MQLKIRTAAVFLLLVATMPACRQQHVYFSEVSEKCPKVEISAYGFIETYKIVLDVDGYERMVLVQNIDLPQDVTQYVKYLKRTDYGMEIGITESAYVKDVSVAHGRECLIRTVRNRLH